MGESDVSNTLLTFGATVGPSWFRRGTELDPYERDYFTTDLSLGVMGREAFTFFDLVPAEVLKWRWMADLDFSYTGGDEKNLGSHRYQLLLRGGLRATLFDLLTLDTEAGVGGAINYLNFGKGFPLPAEFTVNLQARAALGIELCLNRDLCLTPTVGVALEQSLGDLSYHHPVFQLGLLVSGNPIPDPVAPIPVEKERLPERSTDAAKETARASRNRRPPESEETTDHPITVEPPASTARVIWQGLPPVIRFANDNPDIPLQPQWFKDVGPQLFECFANPDLDLYIRALHRWGGKVAERRRFGIHDDITFALHVKGYANDTGDPARNLRLAGSRTKGVIAYLTADTLKPFMSYLSETDPVKYPGRVQELKRRAGIDFHRWGMRPICGAQDHTGLRSQALGALVEQGLLTIINDNKVSAREAKEEILHDFGGAINPKDERFRMARLRLEIRKDGKPLSPEASTTWLRQLEKEIHGE